MASEELVGSSESFVATGVGGSVTSSAIFVSSTGTAAFRLSVVSAVGTSEEASFVGLVVDSSTNTDTAEEEPEVELVGNPETEMVCFSRIFLATAVDFLLFPLVFCCWAAEGVDRSRLYSVGSR